MSDKRPDPAETIYQRALDLPPEQRAAFVERECSSDSALRERVSELLHAYDAIPADFLDSPLKNHVRKASTNKVGQYRIIRLLGEGGMGAVYLAEQESPIRRQVALKVIKPGMDTRQVLARFDVERQALAMLDHPNVARVYDAGATSDGRPYAVLEYIAGPPITSYCDDNRLSTRERVELFMQVCDGVTHAHQKGLLHRDLKPSNVLVATEGDNPIARVIDFGIAKVLEKKLSGVSVHTAVGQFIGTPEYMSPEQALQRDVDTRTDVYSLGVVLYELLAGTAPFTSEELLDSGLEEMVRRIRDTDPPRPSTRVSSGDEASTTKTARFRRTEPRRLIRDLRGDLDWIVMKALEKDRDRRYASVAALAEDLRRFLNNEPVTARPPSAGYRTGKFVRRNRVGVGFSALLLMSLVAIAIVSIIQTRRVALERDRANLEARTSREVAQYFVDAFHGTSTKDVWNLDNMTLRDAMEAWARGIDEGDLSVGARARLKRMIGGVYGPVGREEEGRLLEQAVELSVGYYGKDHLETAEAMHALGVYNKSHDRQKAREMLGQALRVYEAKLPADDPKLPRHHWLYGDLLERLDDCSGAIEHLEIARAGYERLYGAKDGRVSFVLASLAFAHLKAEHFAEAVDAMKTAHEIQAKQYGADNFVTIMTLGALGNVYRQSGQLGQAQTLLEQSRLEMAENHPKSAQLVIVTVNLADVYRSRREYKMAEALLAEARSLRDDHNLRKNPWDIVTMNGAMGRLYVETGRCEDAVTVLSEALDIQHAAYGATHTGVVRTTSLLGRAKSCDGQATQADSLLVQALGVGEKIRPPRRFLVARCKVELARHLIAQQRYTDAEPHLLAAYEVLCSDEDFPQPDAEPAAELLADLYVQWGKPEVAARYRPGGVAPQ